jgi:LysM repeat protein
MKKIAAFFFVIFISLGVFGQKKNQEVDIVNHEVQLGESVRLISKKYLVDPAEIYKLNKFAVDGISQGMILRVPVPRKENAVVQQEEAPDTDNQQPVTAEKAIVEKPVETKAPPMAKMDKTVTVIDRTSTTNHTVEAKETLYSLSKKYAISVDEIRLSNPELKNGLKVGQVIKIPSTKTLGSNESSLGSPETPSAEVSRSESSQSAADNAITHTVAAKETLYSLSKKYNVSVDEIKQQNASVLQHGLQIGQVLTIKKGN